MDKTNLRFDWIGETNLEKHWDDLTKNELLMYVDWLEKRVLKNCSIPDVGLSLPDEDEINSMRLEIDCPTPNEEEYTTAGFKSGVRWLKNTIERQLQGQ